MSIMLQCNFDSRKATNVTVYVQAFPHGVLERTSANLSALLFSYLTNLGFAPQPGLMVTVESTHVLDCITIETYKTELRRLLQNSEILGRIEN